MAESFDFKNTRSRVKWEAAQESRKKKLPERWAHILSKPVPHEFREFISSLMNGENNPIEVNFIRMSQFNKILKNIGSDYRLRVPKTLRGTTHATQRLVRLEKADPANPNPAYKPESYR